MLSNRFLENALKRKKLASIPCSSPPLTALYWQNSSTRYAGAENKQHIIQETWDVYLRMGHFKVLSRHAHGDSLNNVKGAPATGPNNTIYIKCLKYVRRNREFVFWELQYVNTQFEVPGWHKCDSNRTPGYFLETNSSRSLKKMTVDI